MSETTQVTETPDIVVDAPDAIGCPCGCSCGSACDCGCAETGVCTCSDEQAPADPAEVAGQVREELPLADKPSGGCGCGCGGHDK